LITEFMDEVAVKRLSDTYPTTYAPDLADRQTDILALMPEVQALVVRNRTEVTRDLLAHAPNLRLVGRLGVGLDNIDLNACAELDVEVAPATGANTLSVAEYVITNALILLRGAYQKSDQMLNGEWPRAASSGREVSGRVLGFIGYGAIAQETAGLASCLGMRTIAFDPFLPPESAAWGMTNRMELADVLSAADVVSLHVPMTDETRHMINETTLKKMKHDAVLINAARGGVVDEHALAASLRSGHLGGAALDVFETEPLTANSAAVFDGISNLILTPHIAGVTEESNIRVSETITDIVLDRIGKSK
ncbi:MAG: hydroxyacid dehydrogenase, partial [Boseongicola sp.]